MKETFMNCQKAFDRYLSLDKYEHVPLAVTVHLLFCPVCRTSVRRLTLAEKVLAAPLAPAQADVLPQSDDPVVQAALARISSSGIAWVAPEPVDRHVSMFRWLVSGFILAGGFSVLPFTSVGEWSRAAFGPSFIVPFSILCGVAVTGWCGVFVGSNIDFFVKKFGFAHT